MRALTGEVAAGRLPKLAVEKLDGEPVIGSAARGRAARRRLQPRRPAQADRIGLRAGIGPMGR